MTHEYKKNKKKFYPLDKTYIATRHKPVSWRRFKARLFIYCWVSEIFLFHLFIDVIKLLVSTPKDLIEENTKYDWIEFSMNHIFLFAALFDSQT